MEEITGFEKRQIRSLYVWGSRLYGCHNEESDYDLIAVVSGCDYFDQIVVKKSGDYEVTIIHEKKFSELLKDHLFWVVLLVFYPRRAVILEDSSLFTSWR